MRAPDGGESVLGSFVCTARRRGVPFTRVKGTKTRLGLCPKTPVAGCAGYGLICGGSRKSIRTAHRIAPKVAAGASAPTALRCPKKSSRCSLARFFRPLRVLRLAASATGGARLRTPYPSPVAGEGPSGQIAACSTHRLDSVTSCNRFAGTKLKCACGSLSASSNPAPGMRSVSGREGSDA